MFCETILFNYRVCNFNGIGVGVGSGFKNLLEVFLFSNQPPPPPRLPPSLPLPPTLSLTAGVSRVFIFLYDEKRKQQQQQSTKNTRNDKTNKSQNLFNLLNDGFKSILLFCRDSLASSL